MKNLFAIIACSLFYIGLAAQVTVWPGDANNNGTANHFDLLFVGQGYGTTGFPRNSVSNVWAPQTLQGPWNIALPQSGIDYGYLDCNGDGTINSLDVPAIEQNFGLIHGNVLPDNVPAPTFAGALMVFQFPFDSLPSGSTDTVDIVLGTGGAVLDSLYSMAFSISYDTSLVDSIYPITLGSGLASPIDTLISVDFLSKSNGRFDFAISRTNQVNISITGTVPVVSLGLVMVDNLKTAVTSKMLNLTFENAVALTSKETYIPLNPASDSVTVFTGVDELQSFQPQISVFQSREWIDVQSSNTRVQGLDLVDLSGKNLCSTHSEQQNRIFTGQIPQGIYLLRIHTSKGIFTQKMIIL
ncbi:MAG: T9SS type A sorting domain-containing protein [Bacteroidia bacterium]|nr:T9SS type A sorting domain-containing protein [Bacteroidia bacterium]